MPAFRLSLRTLTPLVLLTAPLASQAPVRDRAIAATLIDSIANAALKGGKAAGMSIAVVRGYDTLAMKGYGFADLEFDVPTPPRALYEIGSVTKQFTAAAILQLQEAGKLSLDDEITKYLPTYPMKGHHLTIRRLMDHTSGIKGYTELPQFDGLMMRKLPRDSLVALFSTAPWDFSPGDAMIYNNSAYFLLGLVIEKTSGMSYAEYVTKSLFARANMPDSRYCNESEIEKHRAHGYDTGPKGLINKAYIDQTWPFAAGSLCSTVGDLVAWNRALHGGRILSAASYRELTTPGRLNSGATLRYAKGLAVNEIAGHRAIHHGGGIPGFLSESMYLPDDDMIVVVLINTAGPIDPGGVAYQIVRRLLGERKPTFVSLDHPISDYVGTYTGAGRGPLLTVTVSADSGGLLLKTGTSAPHRAGYLGSDSFDADNARAMFDRQGKVVTALRLDQTFGYYVLKKQ